MQVQGRPQPLVMILRLLCALALMTLGTAASLAAEGTWMNDVELRSAFSGVTLEGKYGNGRPFSESYAAGGRLEYREADRSVGGKWTVESGTFCTIYDADPAGGCYRVKKVGGNCYEFYFVARTEQEARSDQVRPAWTARGSVVGKPGICAEEHSV